MTHHGVWSGLPAISLDELNRLAALETRVDRKYIVPPAVIEELIDGLGPDLQVLEIDGVRRFEYETVYFDTGNFDSYLAAARSRPKRHKVRTRTYLDSELSLLEVKTRDNRERTVKHRLPYTYQDRNRLTAAGRDFVESIVGTSRGDGVLRPVLTNRYARRTVLLPRAGNRATIDSSYFCEALDSGGRAALPGDVIVETKTAGKPGPLDRLLWKAGFRPIRISKYCTGLAVARGGLPANKWHRTIVRHMTLDDASDPTLSDDPELTQVRVVRSQ